MSLHKIPLTQIEEDGLRAHGLDIGTPSQLSDVFRHGVAWALKTGQGEAVEYQQLSRYGHWERIEKSVFDLGLVGACPDRFRALYTATPASSDDRLVPVELLKRIAREADHYDDSPVATINDNCELWQIGHVRLKMTVGDLRELRALLAQSQEVKS